MANSSRRAILPYPRDRDYVRAGYIAADLGVGHSTLSAHLEVLTPADLLISRRQRTEIQYRTNLPVLGDVIVMLSELHGSALARTATPPAGPVTPAAPEPV